LGGVASLATLWHYREAVGRAGFISGSFAHRTDEEWPGFVFDPVVGFLAAMNGERKLAGCRIYQSVGRYEGLCDFNRRLQPILRAAGAEVHYRETWDGHHWGTWRDRLGEALSYLFPGPAGLPHPN
jgi:enterochelin esterase family protein